MEVGGFASVPFATMLLGDLGAEVIKVERPKTGDPWRHGESRSSELNLSFVSHNRNKKSICLDISSQKGREIFLRLASKSDVIVENLRPGTMDNLGIGFDDIVKANSKIVYCSANCFGPSSQKPGYDTIAQATSGLMSLITGLESPELRGPHFADLLTGLFAAYGVLAGVVSAIRSGKAVKLDVSMIGACMSVEAISILQYFATKKVEGPFDRGHRSLAFLLPTKDYPLVIHLSTQEKFWDNLLGVLDMRELLQDERFAKYKDRYVNYDKIKEILQPVFLKRGREEWLEVLVRNDIPCAPINSMKDLVEDEDVKRLDIVKLVSGEPYVLSPINVQGFEKIASRSPDLGQDTEKVLQELGFTQEEIKAVSSS